MATVPKQFAADFEVWAEALRADGEPEAGITEIKDAIRIAFAEGGDAAGYWLRRVADEAAFVRELQAMGAGLTSRTRPPTLAEQAA